MKEKKRERREKARVSDLFRAVEKVIDKEIETKIDRKVTILDAYCDKGNEGCGHALTAHSRGLIVHDRCLIPNCKCKRAVLTLIARDRAKKGIVC